MTAPYHTRKALAEQIRSRRVDLTRRITGEFLYRHPDLSLRHGSGAREREEEDTAFHLDFLAGALLSGDPTPFEEYALWSSDVLEARGLGASFLVENLEQVREHVAALVDDGGSGLVDLYVTAGISAIQAGAEGRETSQEPSEPVRRYLDAALAGDRRSALAVARECIAEGMEVPAVYHEVLTPAQYEIGRLWQGSEISVATEHVATAITQYVVSQIYPLLDVPEPTRGHAVVTGVEGELHQIGAHMVADLLEHDGWAVRFLGSHLPAPDVIDIVAEEQTSLLLISATVLTSLPAVAELVGRARDRFGSDLEILMGGRAFRAGAWDDIGADGLGHTLDDAVRLARAAAN